MKTLYIIRHAKSSWDDASLSDFERPLKKRGFNDAHVMGNLLANKNIMPDLILASPANRALSTAQIIAKEIGYPKEKIIEDENIYHAGTSELVNIINTTDNNISSLMIFGHNPGFTSLANFLGGQSYFNVPTCGIVAIQFDNESWSTIERDTGSIEFYEIPSNHR